MATDLLFSVRNSFYLGAYQAAIAEAADLDTLSEGQKDERDVFVYRSYIELGSYEVWLSSHAKQKFKHQPAIQAAGILPAAWLACLACLSDQ